MMEPKYNFKIVEENKYQEWKDNNFYYKSNGTSSPDFSIILPPPNVTGKLHLGHAWDGAIQDFFIRKTRLEGKDAVWYPGMDHAGIATQSLIEKKLFAEEKLKRFDLGRDEFINRVWDWKEEYSNSIRDQWGKIGFGLNYEKEKFTLDEDVNEKVNDVFIDYYNKGLIYRDLKLINWDPILQTAVSNLEVVSKKIMGKMYYIKYLLEDNGGELVVGTTRPETMFGDTTIFVNPNDERYISFVGKKVINPVNNELLEIIADTHVGIDFGTGAMKCTPAHDFNDYALAKKHNLEMINILNPDGTLNEKGLTFEGLNSAEARPKVVELLETKNAIVKIEDKEQEIPHSERSGAVIEPYLSEQWFVDMEQIKEKIESTGILDKLNFFPTRFKNEFETWLDNMHEWCISRQLWWGHRIPAWYKGDETKVQTESPGEGWERDEDVLDTWFSSALWPIIFAGEQDKEELTDLLVTGYDILFFWVIRMIFQTVSLENKLPFRDVYLHGLIRDELGRKMSKSLGNGVDPIDVIETYGADALRFTLLNNSTPGQDFQYSEDKTRASWNFINKLWNASRFFSQVEDEAGESKYSNWIYSEFNLMLDKYNSMLKKYEMGIAGKEIYDFVWNTFCSWAIEISKGDKKLVSSALEVLKKVLVLINPFIPYVTDEIFRELFKENIFEQEWPSKFEVSSEDDIVSDGIELVTSIRGFRQEKGIKNSFKLILSSKEDAARFNELVLLLANAEFETRFETLNENFPTLQSIITFQVNNFEINNDDKKNELEGLVIKYKSEISRANGMLKNKGFTDKAPVEKIDAEKEKVKSFEIKLEEIIKELNLLE